MVVCASFVAPLGGFPIIIYGSGTFPWSEGNPLPRLLFGKFQTGLSRIGLADQEIRVLALAICGVPEYFLKGSLCSLFPKW